MTASQTTADPWVLCKCLDRSGKSWWAFSLIFKGLAFATGLAAFFPHIPPEPIPFVVAAYPYFGACWVSHGACMAGCSRTSGNLEALNSFGWEISNREMSDLIARCSGSVKKRVKREVTEEPYFASKEEPGPKRAVENVMESAWWSKHLSESMFWTCSVIIGCAIAGSLVALVISILAITDHNTLGSVARIVTAVLLVSAVLRSSSSRCGVLWL